MTPSRSTRAYGPLPPLVAPEWVRDHLDEVVVADVRSYLGRDGRAAFRAGHVPGAVLVDLERDLSAPGGGVAGRHPLPTPDDFATAMGRLGIGDDDTVVAYDDVGGGIAARLVWMLRVTGHAAALLDGGLAAWDGPLGEGPAQPEPATFTARPWPAEHLADATVVDRVRREAAGRLIDARDAERFRGETEPIDATAGHIPGAVNVPFRGNLDPGSGRFRSADEVRERFAAVGAVDADPVVVHCGSGVTACHDLLAMEHAGLRPGRLYVGSWSGWSSDPDRPVATGG